MPLFCGFFLAQNTSAAQLNTLPWYMFSTNAGSNSQITNGAFTNFGTSSNTTTNLVQLSQAGQRIQGISVISDTTTTSGNYANIYWQFNVVARNINYNASLSPYFENAYIDTQYFNLCQFADVNREIVSQNFTTAVTDWTITNGRYQYPAQTLTVYLTATCKVPSGTSGKYLLQFNGPAANSRGLYRMGVSNIAGFYLETSFLDVTYSSDVQEGLLEQQIQQFNTVISQNQQIINQNQEQIDKENAAVDNIENQTPENIDGSTNPQTTSLINVISGFISAFSSINPTNCNLTLEFPDFVGGSRVVDICSGKEKAPQIIEIGSSLLLICVFVPLAFVVIKMIYSEIRSWTNG